MHDDIATAFQDWSRVFRSREAKVVPVGFKLACWDGGRVEKEIRRVES